METEKIDIEKEPQTAVIVSEQKARILQYVGSSL